MNSDFSPQFDSQYPDTIGKDTLSIALIGPDERRRNAAAIVLAGCQGTTVREFSAYPPSLDDVPGLLEQGHDVVIIDLDSDPEYALELVESIGANGLATIMVYSQAADPELLVRCMRSGAREFFSIPFSQSTVAEALVRAAARRPANRPTKKTSGKLLVFFGSKGGVGVTTVSCNYAAALAQDLSQRTLLIDLDLPLGDAILNFGMTAEYSTDNALQDFNRLDSNLLAKLLVKHSSGLSILAAPGKLPRLTASDQAVDKLIAVARQDFDNVVVDMGSRVELAGSALFKDAFTIYLVTQASISELRNSNRLISYFFSSGGPRVEVVINRYENRTLGVTDQEITRALTRPFEWKIPNDHGAVRKMQHTATPLMMTTSPISRQIRQMANSVNPKTEAAVAKKGFRLFG